MDAGLWVYLVLVALLLLFSVVSNILTIVCVAKFKRLRIVTNVLIANLAVSDILLAGFYMPQRLHDLSHTSNYHEGEILCRVINFFPIFVITNSCYTLVCISFERYRAIVNITKPRMSFSQMKKIIPAMWIFSFLVSLPSLLEFTVLTLPLHGSNNTTENIELCSNDHHSRSFVMVNGFQVIVVSFIIPHCLMFYNYTRIALFLKRRGSQVADQPKRSSSTNGFPEVAVAMGGTEVQMESVSGGSMFPERSKSSGAYIQSETPSTQRTSSSYSKASQARRHPCMKSQLSEQKMHIIKMLILVALMFALSWIPFFVIYIITKITGEDASSEASSPMNLLLNGLASFSTAYNVILYIIFNRNFREAFRSLLHI